MVLYLNIIGVTASDSLEDLRIKIQKFNKNKNVHCIVLEQRRVKYNIEKKY